MSKHRTKTEARGLASSTKRAKGKPRTPKRKRPAPLDAGVTRGVPEGQIPPDLRGILIDDRHGVWVRLEAKLVAGCGVALLSRTARR